MTLGTCIKGLNALYFKRYLEFIFEVVTQIALLMCLFGFMDLLIIIKWVTDWDAKTAGTGQQAPGIISNMIIMFIGLGQKPPGNMDADLIPNQESSMKKLLVVAVICVPLMLLVKPCVLARSDKPALVE